jgi:hypothetical protein
VLKRREAVKRRHESAVEANTQTLPIGKGSNQLLALTGTAVRKVTVRKHLLRVLERQGIRPAASRLPTSRTSEYGQVHAHNTTDTLKFSVVHLL